MKRFWIAFLMVIVLLVACSNQEKGKLTRIDIITLFEEKDIEYHIQLEEDLNSIETVFGKVKWDSNVEPKMGREPDVEAIFFYTFDENMPERLVHYDIWFEEVDGIATIISDDKNEGYGLLDVNNSEKLKNIFTSVSQSK